MSRVRQDADPQSGGAIGLLRDSVQRNKRRDALIASGSRASYGEMFRTVMHVASMLAVPEPPQSVLVSVSASPAYVYAFLGALATGRLVHSLDPSLGPEAISAIANSSPDAVRICDDGSKLLLLTGSDVVIVDLADGRSQRAPDEAFENAVKSGAGAVFYTSGTTGAPKGVQLSDATLVSACLRMSRLQQEFFGGRPVETASRMARLVATEGLKLRHAVGHQTWLTSFGLWSIAGHTVMMNALASGHRLVLCDSRHPRDLLSAISEHHVNVFATSPFMAELALRLPEFSKYDLSSLVMVGLGGAPVRPELALEIRERFRCPVAIGYGSTEFAGGVTVGRIHDTLQIQTSTVGRPFPGVNMRIRGDDGEDVPVGHVGHIVCSLAEEGNGSEVARVHGWRDSGDLGWMDGQGNLTVVGRADDIVVRGGRKVAPVRVESALMGHRGVLAAAVVGVPAPLVGEELWAFVVASPEHSLTARDLIGHCRALLAGFEVPDHVEIVSALPQNSAGEVRRAELRQYAIRQQSALRGGADPSHTKLGTIAEFGGRQRRDGDTSISQPSK